MSYLILIIGFIMLIKGADIFVDNSSSLAKKFHIPSIIIGLTIVAMGTSAPELSVSVTSAIAGMNDMSIANVVGSNLFNLLVVLGTSTIISKLKISNYSDIFILFGAALLFLILSLNGILSVIDGAILLVVFISYILYLIIKTMKNNINEVEDQTKQKPIIITLSLIMIGLFAIVWGGDLVVDSASMIAQQLGMSENLIGLTIVALGTSLPELVTSLIATKKGELDIAIGNVIGSNIFNLLLIIGLSSVINPMTVSVFALMDTIFISVITLIFILLTFKSKTLNKAKGIPMILVYIAYIIFTILR